MRSKDAERRERSVEEVLQVMGRLGLGSASDLMRLCDMPPKHGSEYTRGHRKVTGFHRLAFRALLLMYEGRPGAMSDALHRVLTAEALKNAEQSGL